MKKGVILTLLIILVSTPAINACSSIWIISYNSFILGANLDGEGIWKGLIYINQKNKKKKTDNYNTGNKDYCWTSKYGSVTFNLVCREYPQYGMNEQGLIVSTVSNPETTGLKKDNRPSLIGNFWAQYVLDMCENTSQVLETLNKIRIEPGLDRYIICDRNNNSAIIEFQNYEVIVYEDESLPITAVTNQPYKNCLNYYYRNELPHKTNIFDYITTQRFFTAANNLKKKETHSKSEDVNFIFNTLKKIEGSPESQWRLVFDQSEMKIYYISKENKKRRFIDLKQIDFSCGNELISADIDANINDGTTQLFEAYSQKSDFEIYKLSMRNVGKIVTDTEIWSHINFLNTFNCD